MHSTPLQFPDLPTEMRQVHEAWVKAKGRNIGPSRRDFDLLFIPLRSIPYSSVTDYSTDKDEFIIRFFGTGLVGLDGDEMTGKNLFDTPHAGLRNILNNLFRKVVTEKRENFSEVQFISLSGVQRMSITARWPLSENGNDVTGVLSVVHPMENIRKLSEILAGKATE